MSNKKLIPVKKNDRIRSGRIGTVHATYDELVKILGEPHDRTQEGEWKSGDNKVRVEWAFLINGKKELLFTIYDYKSRYNLEEIKQWSLGGKKKKIKLQIFL